VPPLGGVVTSPTATPTAGGDPSRKKKNSRRHRDSNRPTRDHLAKRPGLETEHCARTLGRQRKTFRKPNGPFARRGREFSGGAGGNNRTFCTGRRRHRHLSAQLTVCVAAAAGGATLLRRRLRLQRGGRALWPTCVCVCDSVIFGDTLQDTRDTFQPFGTFHKPRNTHSTT